MESAYVEQFRSCILDGKYEELFSPLGSNGTNEGRSLIKPDDINKEMTEDRKPDSLFDKVTTKISKENKHILTYFVFE